jgi:hypothetical protein
MGSVTALPLVGPDDDGLRHVDVGNVYVRDVDVGDVDVGGVDVGG